MNISEDSQPLLNSLSEEQQNELFVAYEESFDESNLMSHDQVKLQYEKWLKL